MNFFFYFLIFTAPGDQHFFKADGRSDRVENWRIPKDTAVPLSPPTGNTQEAPAASAGGDSGREWPRRAGSTTQERSEGIAFKILHAMHVILSLLYSLYLLLETVFYIRFRRKKGAQTNRKYNPGKAQKA